MRIRTLATLLFLPLLFACSTLNQATSDLVEITPDASLVDVLPVEEAKDNLSAVLSRAWTRRGPNASYSRQLENIEVRDEGFAFHAVIYRGMVGFKSEEPRTFRFTYRDLSPKAFNVWATDSYVISLYGIRPGLWDGPTKDCIWVTNLEDVQLLLDSILVLAVESGGSLPVVPSEPEVPVETVEPAVDAATSTGQQ